MEKLNYCNAAFSFWRLRQSQPRQEGKALFHFMHDEALVRISLFFCAQLNSQERK